MCLGDNKVIQIHYHAFTSTEILSDKRVVWKFFFICPLSNNWQIFEKFCSQFLAHELFLLKIEMPEEKLVTFVFMRKFKVGIKNHLVYESSF